MQEDITPLASDTKQGSRLVHHRYGAYALMVSAAPLFFAITTPQAVPSILLIGGFLVLAVSLYGGLRLLFLICGLERRVPAVYRRGFIAIGTVLPVLLLMLQSIGQLTLRDILTLGGLCLLGIFYVGRIAGGEHR